MGLFKLLQVLVVDADDQSSSLLQQKLEELSYEGSPQPSLLCRSGALALSCEQDFNRLVLGPPYAAGSSRVPCGRHWRLYYIEMDAKVMQLGYRAWRNRVHGPVDCSPLKDRHLDAVTRCASGAEASSLLRKGDAGIDIVLVEVRSCLMALNSDDKITGRSGICEIGLSHTARAHGMEACIPLWSFIYFYGEAAGCPGAFWASWNITRALRPGWPGQLSFGSEAL